ncbi:UNVERIFIED_CONTAM: Plastidal glycolate/glycerate translocator 1, chloroplastic [Sesamum calycinum]|uniref:Plastidal glycolate/glycerate translocator 1, chloroplastic n=1 Tax=Sesamum calycinum TaxID=2727403 RepID=A0AAW2M161_9LAMI
MAATSAISQIFTPFVLLPYRHCSRVSHFNPGKKSRKISSKLFTVAANSGGIRMSRNGQPTHVVGLNSGLLLVDHQEMGSRRRVYVKSAGSASGLTSAAGSTVVKLLHLVVSLGIILAMDKLLKKAFVAAAIKFPSALFGMFCIFTILMVLDSTVPAAATGLMNFFQPALLFIQRWLPLFYVPSLVVLPLAVKDIPAASGLKIIFIIVGGWLASLSVAGFTAIAVRKMVNTEMTPAEPMPKPSQSQKHCLPFLLASTVLGYLLGSGLPNMVKKVFHPIICCALSADLAAFAYGQLSRSGLNPVLGYYLTKASSNPGAGDISNGISWIGYSLICLLNVPTEKEIFTSVILSTLFSLYSTALIGRLVGLEPSLTVSILPRCITVALALSIVSFFEGANTSLTAAVVVVTGLVGANFVQTTLDKLGFRDPIARGIATASSAHGLGTAALSAKEPEALPFCAIAYALTGIFGSVICSVPAVRQSLLAIIG